MLPKFRYHPDPLATGSVEASDETCACCGQGRGYVYTASVYAVADLHRKLCPWCIASGSAASRYDCRFCDERPLRRARLPRAVVLEVSRKTPGYSSWQQDRWQVCCGDACMFQGDASKGQLTALAGESLARHLRRWKWPAEYWRQFVAAYEPRGSMSVFRFVCHHCGDAFYVLDMA